MNYAYDVSLAGSPPTLADTKIQFLSYSRTIVPPVGPTSLDETSLSETTFDRSSRGWLEALQHYGDPGHGRGFLVDVDGARVDWNHDGRYDASVSANIADGSAREGARPSSKRSVALLRKRIQRISLSEFAAICPWRGPISYPLRPAMR